MLLNGKNKTPAAALANLKFLSAKYPRLSLESVTLRPNQTYNHLFDQFSITISMDFYYKILINII
jgi:hypothetical protein